MALRAIIFDFDGLIIETETPDFQSWHELYAEYHCQLSLDVWLPMIGTGNSTQTFHPHTHLEQLLGYPLDQEMIRARRKPRFLELIAQQPIMPGVQQLITTAQQRQLKLAVASSSTTDWVHGHLRARNLHHHFEHIVCGDQVPLAKPHPDVYLTALNRLGVQAHEAIALEDSPNGVKAARAAGLFCVAVPGPMTRHCSFAHASMQLNDLTELILDELVLQA